MGKVPEPAHLVNVVKVCPSCQSHDIRWRYYNNMRTAGTAQPRYQCRACEVMFTYGGKYRSSKEEDRLAALGRAQKVKVAEKRAGKHLVMLQLERHGAKKAAKINAAKRAVKEAAREQAVLGAVEPPRRSSQRILRRTASPTTFKTKKVPRIRLRLIGGTLIDLPSDSETDTPKSLEVEAGAGASPAAVMQEGEAALGSGPTVPESTLPVFDIPLDILRGLVGSWESGVADCFASGRWESELESFDQLGLDFQPELAITESLSQMELAGLQRLSENVITESEDVSRGWDPMHVFETSP